MRHQRFTKPHAFLVVLVSSSLLAAQSSGWQVGIEPETPFLGDNIAMVISGTACNPWFSSAELSAASATAIHGFECLAPPAPFTTRVPLGALPIGDYIARAVDEDGGLIAETRFTVDAPVGPPASGCMPSADVLCLRGGAYRVEARFLDALDVNRWGHPRVRLMSFESGALYFFRSSNAELFVKILDGCGLNGHYWLFTSGLTNLGVSVRVRDTQTGVERVIDNPQGTAFPSWQDTSAFACGGS